MLTDTLTRLRVQHPWCHTLFWWNEKSSSLAFALQVTMNCHLAGQQYHLHLSFSLDDEQVLKLFSFWLGLSLSFFRDSLFRDSESLFNFVRKEKMSHSLHSFQFHVSRLKPFEDKTLLFGEKNARGKARLLSLCDIRVKATFFLVSFHSFSISDIRKIWWIIIGVNGSKNERQGKKSVSKGDLNDYPLFGLLSRRGKSCRDGESSSLSLVVFKVNKNWEKMTLSTFSFPNTPFFFPFLFICDVVTRAWRENLTLIPPKILAMQHRPKLNHRVTIIISKVREHHFHFYHLWKAIDCDDDDREDFYSSIRKKRWETREIMISPSSLLWRLDILCGVSSHHCYHPWRHPWYFRWWWWRGKTLIWGRTKTFSLKD